MKTWVILIGITLMVSCQSKQRHNEELKYKEYFNQEEQEILNVADSIIKSAYYTTLITLDKNKQPRARIVEPFLPKENHIIWIATNPKSRKVNQIKNNSTTTLHYFDKNKLAYVSLMGNSFLVNDDKSKDSIWKDGWEKFYPNKKTDYLLIKFIPKSIELIDVSENLTGNKETWKPHQVKLIIE